MKFHIHTWLNLLLLFLVTFIFWGCPDSASTPDPESPLGKLQFTYLQNDQILYFAIDVASSYRTSSLDITSTKLKWFGTDKTDTLLFDLIELNDEGTSGDILKDDGLYSRKIINNRLALSYPIEYDSSTGKVYLEFQATYGNGSTTFTVEDSFYLGNIIPKIKTITAPDTLFLPDSSSVIFQLVTATVVDANGPSDIRRVGFFSYHVDQGTFLNEGNIINLYDDGSEVILYEPNFTSGDEDPNDGTYSFKIPVFGPGNSDPGLETKTGTFWWIFDAVDMANTHSNPDTHTVIVEP